MPTGVELPPPLIIEEGSGGVESTLNRLDDAVNMLASLHGHTTTRGRRGKIDLAALVWEVSPEARVQLEMGEGTAVFGDEAELRRMLHVLIGMSGDPSSTGGTPSVTVRRNGDEVRVGVNLGPDTSTSFETERVWLSRMAVRYGGRLELDGSTRTLILGADVDTHRRELESLKRELAADDETVAIAIALVRGCHPRPGTIVGAGAAEFVVPDVFVRRTDRGWSVEINPATVPRVRLNESYASLIGRNSSHTTMRTQLQEARWLLKSLEIRNDTMLKVARAIVERQSEFLEQGEEFMRPMILKDIAEAISMHESTISRVTSGKYMLTPRGVFELRFFFSSQVEGEDGQGTSSTAIRAKIRKLVREETHGSPLSDNRIAEILSGEGIPVARRTVAKYREAMGIASSAERKRASAK